MLMQRLLDGAREKAEREVRLYNAAVKVERGEGTDHIRRLALNRRRWIRVLAWLNRRQAEKSAKFAAMVASERAHEAMCGGWD